MNRQPLILTASLLLSLFTLHASHFAFAQCPWTFNNPTPAYGDGFGYSVAISGNNVLVGAWWDDTGAEDAGSAYLFDAATGSLLRTFNNPTPEEFDYFGGSLAISGNNVLVGASRDDTWALDAGNAYLFDAATGSLLRTFNYDPALGAGFGNSVAISGNNVLVGDYYDDTGARGAGSASLFDAVTGSHLRAFNNPTPAGFDFFGWTVAISGNNVLVGAFYDDTGATDAGSAYLFDAATGSLLRTFNNPTPAGGDSFGGSVAISGNNVLVGAWGDDTGGGNAGIAYLFDAATGSLLQTFNSPTPPYDQFGYSVGISGNNVLVGAFFDDTGANDAGSAYLFDFYVCPSPTPSPSPTPGPTASPTPSPTETPIPCQTLQLTLNNPSPEEFDYFGTSVAISGNNILVGAYGDDTGTTYTATGSAHLFDAATGALLRTFNNPTPGFDDQFGRSVAISGNNVLVGAYFDDTWATNAGSAYLFDAETGSLLQTFNNPTSIGNILSNSPNLNESNEIALA